jgi:hypothetical protein
MRVGPSAFDGKIETQIKIARAALTQSGNGMRNSAANGSYFQMTET